ncbi:MAG: DNA polymerase III subunit beta [Patescibacteria group bacterium]|jgi:DNA polymerase-3 subunit beta|nr:DNA polymerase III subunit beta [Patescibacteria group bacterium]
MKIIVIKENLKKSFSDVEGGIGSGVMLPILKNVLITTDDGRIKICSTDLEIAITSWINGKIVDEGGITVPANILGMVLNNISESKIELDSTDSKLKIKTDKSENIIQGIKDSEYPIIPTIKSDNYIEIKSDVLKKSLNQIISAAASSDRRIELNGILFYLNNELKMVATDTFRLAEKTLKNNEFQTNITELRAIIPLKVIQEFLKICKEDKVVKIYFDPHQVMFDLEDVQIISRLIEGNFPDYQSIIPQDFLTTVLINKEFLYNAIKLASVFSSKINNVNIKIKSPNKFIVYNQESSIGETKSELDAEINGENQELIFNWHYLIDGLKNIESEEVFLGFNGDIKPLFIKSPTDNNYFYILMPIKNN